MSGFSLVGYGYGQDDDEDHSLVAGGGSGGNGGEGDGGGGDNDIAHNAPGTFLLKLGGYGSDDDKESPSIPRGGVGRGEGGGGGGAAAVKGLLSPEGSSSEAAAGGTSPTPGSAATTSEQQALEALLRSQTFPRSASPGISPPRSQTGEPLPKRPRIDYSTWKLTESAPMRKVVELTPPSDELVSKVKQYFEFKRSGKNLNRDLRRKKQFNNPDILELLAAQCQIMEIGSNYPPEIYNPLSWPAEAFYDAISKRQLAQYERDEKAKKQVASRRVHPSGGGGRRKK